MLHQKIIKIPIFNYRVYVYIFDHKKEIQDIYSTDDTWEACTLEAADYCSLLLPNNKYFLGNLTHECTHVKNCLFRYIGQECARDNDEIEAYILEYLLQQIYTFYQKI